MRCGSGFLSAISSNIKPKYDIYDKRTTVKNDIILRDLASNTQGVITILDRYQKRVMTK